MDKKKLRQLRRLQTHPVQGWDNPLSRLLVNNMPKASVPGKVRRARQREAKRQIPPTTET